MLLHGAGAAFFLPGAGADPMWSEAAPGPRTSGAGAAQKSGGSATLHPGSVVSCEAGFFWSWSLLCDLGVLWWQSCDNSYNLIKF